MKRFFDVALALCVAVVAILPLLIIGLLVRLTSRGPALYWSDRVGRDNRIFRMPKFRSMRTSTPQVASHLLANPDAYLTPLGRFLRRTSLDELPQLWNILKGEMSFVGPRPALYNQHDLITARTDAGVHTLTPGLTGWAQIHGRDELPIAAKVELDEYYSHHASFWFDLQILILTAWKVLRGDGTAVPSHVAGARNSREMAEALLESARTWEQQGDFERAMADLNQAIGLDSENAELFRYRASVWLAFGHSQARRDLMEAARIDPQWATVKSEPVLSLEDVLVNPEERMTLSSWPEPDRSGVVERDEDAPTETLASSDREVKPR